MEKTPLIANLYGTPKVNLHNYNYNIIYYDICEVKWKNDITVVKVIGGRKKNS